MRALAALLLAACGGAAHAGPMAVSVLDRDGHPVAEAVVVLVPAQAGLPAQGLPRQATVLQEKMQFVPAVTLVPVGARLTFVNNDSWEHHVRGTAAGILQFAQGGSGGFELRLDGKADGKPAKSADTVMDKPGPVLLGCHIHGSMRGHVFVSDSPWAAKTGTDGIASFEAVPDGAVQVRVWQADQLVDLPARTVTSASALQKVEFRLQVVPRRRRT